MTLEGITLGVATTFLLMTLMLAVSGCVSGQQQGYEYDIRMPVSGDIVFR